MPNCVFISDWTCPMEVDEIPVEVCRLCLEARRIHVNERGRTIKRAIRRAEAPQPPIERRIPESELECLSSLNRRLLNNEITMEEYLQRRDRYLQRKSDT